MASMRDIKRRRSSIQSTQQITKAMKLVSTVKLQRAKTNAEKSKEYFNAIYEAVHSMLGKTANINHPYLQGNESKKKAVILFTSNRGLAGGYDSNVIKLITKSDFDLKDLKVYAAGKKGMDAMKRFGCKVHSNECDAVDEPSFDRAVQISKDVLEQYVKGEVGEVYIAYTVFKNTVTHIPTLLRVLPIESMIDVPEADDKAMMNFEPEEEEALDMIIPKYVSSLIYGALVESIASENGARMQAMDSATSNAEDLIQKLSLQYNRARQGSITQELTEIIAGAEAIS